MDIYGLIVLYKPTGNMIANINKLASFVKKMVIFDNSEDDIKYFENNDVIEYIKSESNVGLAKALNIGFEFLYNIGAKWAIYFDQDTTIKEDIVKNYFDKLKYDENVALYTPLYNVDRHKTPKKNFKFENIKWTMTSASIFNIDVLNKLGYFDERYFLDCVDYEYCLRANKNNYAIVQYGGYVFEHCPGITKTSKILKYKYGWMSPLRYYYQLRNLRLLKKDYKYWKINLIILLKQVKMHLFFDNKKEYVAMKKKAFKDFKDNKFYKYY